IFDAIANRGWSLRRVCRELDARGVKPPISNGRPRRGDERWSTRTIRKFLRNRKYIGDMPWNETHCGKYSSWKNGAVEQSQTTNQQKPRHGEDDGIAAPDQTPPLIDRDTFTRAQTALVANQKRTSPGRGHNYLLTRVLVCGDCGAFMTGI